MNYFKAYLNLIESAKLKNRMKGSDDYFEEHHIVPKCLSGSDDKENLVLLTAKEHYIAHHLLHKHYKENKSLFLAYHFMSFTKNKENITATEYEKLRKLNCFYNTGENNPNYKNKQNLSGKRNHKSISVIIFGKLYESINLASQELKISSRTLRRYLKRGSDDFKKVLDMAN